MAKYVMSDLHGQYDEFVEMLDLINFSSEDTLYILGDVFDRGEDPIEIMDFIIGRRNVHMIMGNHERMFIDYVDSGYAFLWYANGGRTTHEKIIEKGMDYEIGLYEYIKKLPQILLVDNYILVHAGIYLPKDYESKTIEEIVDMQDEETLLWDRSFIGNERKIKDYKIICGHTPVQTLPGYKESSVPEIKIVNGTYYIDCGCYFKGSKGRLSCMRLDDEKVFYV